MLQFIKYMLGPPKRGQNKRRRSPAGAEQRTSDGPSPPAFSHYFPAQFPQRFHLAAPPEEERRVCRDPGLRRARPPPLPGRGGPGARAAGRAGPPADGCASLRRTTSPSRSSAGEPKPSRAPAAPSTSSKCGRAERRADSPGPAAPGTRTRGRGRGSAGRKRPKTGSCAAGRAGRAAALGGRAGPRSGLPRGAARARPGAVRARPGAAAPAAALPLRGSAAASGARVRGAGLAPEATFTGDAARCCEPARTSGQRLSPWHRLLLLPGPRLIPSQQCCPARCGRCSTDKGRCGVLVKMG